MSRWVITVCALVGGAVCASTAVSAAVIDVTATGDFYDVGSGALGSISVGDTFSFQFRYDNSVPASFNNGSEAYYPAVTSYSLLISHSGGSYSGSGNAAPIRVLNNFGAFQLDAFQFDQFNPGVTAFPNVNSAALQYLYMNISNPGGTPLGSTSLPDNVEIADFANRTLQIAWQAPSTYANARVGSLTFTPVPEASSMSLLALGSLILLRRRRAHYVSVCFG